MNKKKIKMENHVDGDLEKGESNDETESDSDFNYKSNK